MIKLKIYISILMSLVFIIFACNNKKENANIVHVENNFNKLKFTDIDSIIELFNVEKIEANTQGIFVEQIFQGLTHGDFNGNIYLVSIGGKVYKFNNKGVLVRTLFKVGNGPNEYSRLGSITVDKNQNIFIDDYKHRRIIEYDSLFKFVKYFNKGTTSPSPFVKMLCYKNNLLVGLSIFDKKYGLFKYRTDTGVLTEKCGSPDERALKYYSFLNGGDISYKDGTLFYIKPHYYQIFTDKNCIESSIINFIPSKFIVIDKRPKSIYKFRVKYSLLQNLYVENRFFILKYWFGSKGQGHKNYDIISKNGKLLRENVPFSKNDPQNFIIRCSNGEYLKVKYRQDSNDIKLIFYILKLKKKYK